MSDLCDPYQSQECLSYSQSSPIQWPTDHQLCRRTCCINLHSWVTRAPPLHSQDRWESQRLEPHNNKMMAYPSIMSSVYKIEVPLLTEIWLADSIGSQCLYTHGQLFSEWILFYNLLSKGSLHKHEDEDELISCHVWSNDAHILNGPSSLVCINA